LGILARNRKVYAELVDDTEAKDLIPIITKKIKSGTRICSDTWRAYTGLATKGYVHRTVEHQKKEYTMGRNHINGLEGFWGGVILKGNWPPGAALEEKDCRFI